MLIFCGNYCILKAAKPYIFMSTKEQFLLEHNRLSPSHLQATLALLDQFQIEKKPLLKKNEWVLDKLRMPFIIWLSSLPPEKKKYIRKSKKQLFKNYPETKLIA